MPPPKIKEWIEKNYKPEVDMTKVPLHFTANEDGSSIKLVCYDIMEEGFIDSWCELEYSTDGMKSWKDYPKEVNSEEAEIKLDSCENKTVYFRAKRGNVEGNPNLNGFCKNMGDKYHSFEMKGSVKADGNIQFLLENTGTAMETPSYCYIFMFYQCASLTQAPLLPATKMAERCYQYMFYGCGSLTQAPALPATTLAEYCYYSMFYGCGSLTQAPELLAETLAYDCYKYMFENCTSLTNAYFPNLNSNTVIDEVVGEQYAFAEAADNIETQCSDGTIIINSTEA